MLAVSAGFVEQGLSLLEIARVDPFSQPAVNRASCCGLPWSRHHSALSAANGEGSTSGRPIRTGLGSWNRSLRTQCNTTYDKPGRKLHEGGP